MLYLDTFLICFGIFVTFQFLNASFDFIEKIKTGIFIEVGKRHIILGFIFMAVTLIFTIRFSQLVIGN